MDWTGVAWLVLIKLSINISLIVLSSMARLGFVFRLAEYRFPVSFVSLEFFQLELQVEGPLEVGVFFGVEVSEVFCPFKVGRS